MTVVLPEGHNHRLEAALPLYLTAIERDEKVLVFCDTRRRVDDIAAAMREQLERIRYEVRAHHGSLSQRKREGAEKAMQRADRIVLFSTSTLELGIDIGDIDLVVLDGPPPSIPSLIQRIGRGNRRTERTRVMPCAVSDRERLILNAMIDAAQDGWLGPVESGPQHAVARQQVVTYIYQAPKRARSRERIDELLRACAAPIVQRELVPQMLRTGELSTAEAGSVRLGDDLLEEATSGRMHSNIEQPMGLEVVDELTGEQFATGLGRQSGKGLRIAGIDLQVRRQEGRTIEARRAGKGDSLRGDWNYVIRRRMRGASQPQAVRRYLQIPADIWPSVQHNDRGYVFHFGGVRRQIVLRLLAQASSQGSAPEGINEWYLEFDQAPTEAPVWTSGTSVPSLAIDAADALEKSERLFTRPLANRSLSAGIRRDEVLGWLNLEEELSAIEAATWVAEPQGQRDTHLVTLIA